MSEQVIQISAKKVAQIAGLCLFVPVLFLSTVKAGNLILGYVNDRPPSLAPPQGKFLNTRVENTALLQVAYRELFELYPPNMLSESLYTKDFLNWYETNRDGNLLRGRATSNPVLLAPPILIWEREGFRDLILLVEMNGGYKAASIRLVDQDAGWQIDKLWYVHGRKLPRRQDELAKREIPSRALHLLEKASIELLELHSPEDLTLSAYTSEFIETYSDLWDIWKENPSFGTLNPEVLDFIVIWQHTDMLDVVVKSATDAGYIVMELRLVPRGGDWKVDRLLLGPTNRARGQQ